MSLSGMVFCINIGFANLSNPHADDAAGKVYALFVGDTVLVNNVSTVTSDAATGDGDLVCRDRRLLN